MPAVHPGGLVVLEAPAACRTHAALSWLQCAATTRPGYGSKSFCVLAPLLEEFQMLRVVTCWTLRLSTEVA